MKSLLVTVLALATLPAFAAQAKTPSQTMQNLQSFGMDNYRNPFYIHLDVVYNVRETLIRKYVLGTHQIAAVSVCGTDDVFDVPENYLCVYIHRKDSKAVQQKMFDGETDNKIDGVRIVIEIVD